MEIHELNTGTPSMSDYLGMDTGSDTYKTMLKDMLKAGSTRLTIVLGSSNYTLQRGWAFRTGNIVTFCVAMATSVAISGGTVLFRLDEGSTKRPPIIDNTGNSQNWNFTQYISSNSSVTIAGGGLSGGVHYILSGGSVAANGYTVVSGSYICDL